MDKEKVKRLLQELRSKYGFNFEKYRDSLKARESSGNPNARVENRDPMKSAYGQYQFTPARLVDLGFSEDEINNIRRGTDKGVLLADEALRRQVAYSYDKNKDSIASVLSSNPNYNVYGALAAIHLGGEGGIQDIAAGREPKADKFGTTPLDYMGEFSGIVPESRGLDDNNFVKPHLDVRNQQRQERADGFYPSGIRADEWTPSTRSEMSAPPTAISSMGSPIDQIPLGSRRMQNIPLLSPTELSMQPAVRPSVPGIPRTDRAASERPISKSEIDDLESAIKEGKEAGAEVDELEAVLKSLAGTKSEKQRQEDILRARSLMNSFNSIRNIREAKGTISDINRELKKLKAPQAPNIPNVPPALRNAYDQSLMNLARPISPAEMEAMSRMSTDNFLQQRGIATISSGGQGGAFGSMMQRAAIGRDRMNLGAQAQMGEMRRAALGQNIQAASALDASEAQRAALRAQQYGTASNQYLERARQLDYGKMTARANLANSRNTLAEVLPHALSGSTFRRPVNQEFTPEMASRAVNRNRNVLSLEGGKIFDNLNVDRLRELNMMENDRLNGLMNSSFYRQNSMYS